jgi:hypothetical protein
MSKWEVAIKVTCNFNYCCVKMAMADNFEWWCVKMGSGSQSGGLFYLLACQNGKWQSKVPHDFNCCCVKMVNCSRSGGQFSVVVCQNGKWSDSFKWWCDKMRSGSQSGKQI